jgi:hypothetical protein
MGAGELSVVYLSIFDLMNGEESSSSLIGKRKLSLMES